jgi:glutamate 5-kinase
LSDVDGLYADKDDASSLIRIVDNLVDYKHLAGDAESANGTGGMLTKFEAAKIAISNGLEMYIANGRQEDVIARTLAGEVGTHFAG